MKQEIIMQEPIIIGIINPEINDIKDIIKVGIIPAE